MSLRIAVAAPFVQSGAERLAESEFVVALSLDRNWFTPDQAKRLVDIAVGEGILARTDGELEPNFEADDVQIPEGFTPDESVLVSRSVFERMLDAIVSAGTAKQTAVADINQLQRELDVTIEAATAIYATRNGVDVSEAAVQARQALGTTPDAGESQ